MTALKATALAALLLAPAGAYAADLDYYPPPPAAHVHTQKRVLAPVVRRNVVEQPVIEEQVVVPRVVERRVVEQRPVVERRIVRAAPVVEEFVEPAPVVEEEDYVAEAAPYAIAGAVAGLAYGGYRYGRGDWGHARRIGWGGARPGWGGGHFGGRPMIGGHFGGRPAFGGHFAGGHGGFGGRGGWGRH